MSLLKKYWLIFLLFLIAILLLFLKIKYSCRGEDCLKKINTKDIVENSKKDLRSVLPYEGEYFKTEKYMNNDYLEIIIKNGSSLNSAKEEVENWLKSNNTSSQGIQLIYVFEQNELAE